MDICRHDGLHRLALALVEGDLSVEVPRAVARKLGVYHRRAGGQSQFQALLELEPKSDRILDTPSWHIGLTLRWP